MKRRIAAVVVGVLVVSTIWINAQAKPPVSGQAHSANYDKLGKKQSWVYRHNGDDPNSHNGSFATVVHLDHAGFDTMGKPQVYGDLYFWRQYISGAYAELHHYKLGTADAPVTVKQAGGADRKHESCTFTAAPPGALGPSGDPPINVYISMYKAKGKAARSNHRLVVRFKYPPTTAKGENTDTGDCCDEEPDDDVLEEEGSPGDGTPPDPDQP